MNPLDEHQVEMAAALRRWRTKRSPELDVLPAMQCLVQTWRRVKEGAELTPFLCRLPEGHDGYHDWERPNPFALCNRCGACCEVVDPFDGPIEEASRRAYAVMTAGGPFKPCRYLAPDKTCAIYDTRPKECYIEPVRGSMTDEQLFEGCRLLHLVVRGEDIPE